VIITSLNETHLFYSPTLRTSEQRPTDLEVFVAARHGRDDEYANQTKPTEERREEEEEQPDRNPRAFSIEDLVAELRPGYIRNTISFPWEEFRELYALATEAMTQRGRGRSSRRSPITRFLISILYITSGLTTRSITAVLNLKKGCIAHIAATYIRPVAAALESPFPRAVGDVVCREAFPNYPHVFAAVDASPIFVNRAKGH
jgi:hypothetical protein